MSDDLIERLNAKEKAEKEAAPVTYPLRRSSSSTDMLPAHVQMELLDSFIYEDVERDHEGETDALYTGPRWFFTQEGAPGKAILIWIGSRDEDISVLFPGSTVWLRADNHYLMAGSRVSPFPSYPAASRELWVIQREDRVWLRLAPDAPARQIDAVHVIRYLVAEE